MLHVGCNVIQRVFISHDSEERRHKKEISWNQEDPVNHVYFYKKETPWKAENGGNLFESSEASRSPAPKRFDLMLPRAFKVEETRVYSQEKKRKAVER